MTNSIAFSLSYGAAQLLRQMLHYAGITLKIRHFRKINEILSPERLPFRHSAVVHLLVVLAIRSLSYLGDFGQTPAWHLAKPGDPGEDNGLTCADSPLRLVSSTDWRDLSGGDWFGPRPLFGLPNVPRRWEIAK